MRKWITILAIALCFCLCLSFIVYAEEEPTETPEVDYDIIDFNFCFMTVPDEEYALLETDCPQKELSLLQVLYYDFNGEEQQGKIIVNYHLEYEAIDALQDLYEANLRIDDISLFTGDGFDIAFMAPPMSIITDDDPYNQIFDRYGFAWNENQTGGARHYTLDHEIPDWYPSTITSGLL